MCGEDIKILESLTYLGRVVIKMVGHIKKSYGGLSKSTVLWLHLAREYLALSVPVQTEKDSDLHVAGDPCLSVLLRLGH